LITERIYLDFNATAPLRPEAAEAVGHALTTWGNASSVHYEGRTARANIELARDQVAELVNGVEAGIVFTGGGTEANNLAVSGVISAEGISRILVSAIEHPSVLEAARAVGIPLREVSVGSNGVIELDDLAQGLGEDDGRALVSVMLANNETGAVQPVAEITNLAHHHGAVVHTDAVQAAGKMAVDFSALGVDMMSLSSHKIGGPQGAGALLLRDGLKLHAQMRGGGQEMKRRAGTENVAALAGFGAAARYVSANTAERTELARLRTVMESAIAGQLPEANILCATADRLPNTSCVAVRGVPAEYLLIALDLAGFALSSGSACSSGKVTRSHVLGAMGVGDDLADAAIRISLGWSTSERQVRQFTEIFAEMCKRRIGAAAVAAA